MAPSPLAPGAGRPPAWRRPWVGPALVALAFALLYASVCGYGFVWDDAQNFARSTVYDEPLAQALAASQHDHMDPALRRLRGVEMGHDSYRPALFLSYKVDQWLFGFDPRAMHCHGLLLGCACLLLFHAFASRRLGSRRASLAATAIFALHPLQVEPVTYVSARGEILGAIFCLACCLALEGAASAASLRRRLAMLLGAALPLYLLSLFTKESSLGLPLAAGAFLVLEEPRSRLRWLAIGVLGAGALIYLAIRLRVFGGAAAGSPAAGLAALPAMFLDYLGAFLLPFDLSTARPFRSSLLVPGLAALAGLAVLALAALARRVPKDAATAAAGLLWMVAMLAPSSVVVRMHGVSADRYMYQPLMGLSIASVALGRIVWERWPRLRRPLAAAAALYAALLVCVSATLVGTWRDNRTLYSYAVATAPLSSAAHYRLGVTLSGVDGARATSEFETAVLLDPGNEQALNNLGVMRMRAGRLDEAAAAFDRCIAVSRGAHWKALLNRGLVHLRQGEKAAGCASIGKALAIDPEYAEARAEWERSCSAAPN